MAQFREFEIYLGRVGKEDIFFPGSEHAAAYAKSRSGKTSSLAIPNAFYYEGSLVVLDIKGEIFRATAGYRAEKLGQEVYVFAPGSDRTHRWNPLGFVERRSAARFEQISRLAFMLFPEAAATGANSGSNA